MVRRFVLLPLASVLVGVCLLTAFGAGHLLVRYQPGASRAGHMPVDLVREAGALRAFGQLARLGVDRHELAAAGHRLGISAGDLRGAVHAARQVENVPAATAVRDTVRQVRGRSVAGVNLIGLALAGLIGFPVVVGFFLPLRHIVRRLDGSSEP